MKKYITIEKEIGETPLVATERARTLYGIDPAVPLAYAGRLDPMASGRLLILVGDECKVQEKYHTLDKEYEFDVLLGIDSDTHDILGIIAGGPPPTYAKAKLHKALRALSGVVTLPYPHFSSKTVRGKPLHMWTLEKRLNEIEIPTKTTRIYTLTLQGEHRYRGEEIVNRVRENIRTLPPVTDPRKALGEDFRRHAVLSSWDDFLSSHRHDVYTVLTLRAIASSGTYMRTLAAQIGNMLGTKALAYRIVRTRIGKVMPLPFCGAIFIRTY